MTPLRIGAAVALVSQAWGQELLWQAYSPVDSYSYVASFGDYNHDGYDDVLSLCFLNNTIPVPRILSGRDGSVLYQGPPHGASVNNLACAGDFDGDGYLDYAVAWDDQVSTYYAEIWSPHLNQRLLLVSAPATAFFGAILMGNVDLDGDGLLDLIVGAWFPQTSYLNAYSHSGALLYQIPAMAYGLRALAVAAVGDIDGDGATDFVVGGVETPGEARGVVALVSGRTGSVIRIHVGDQPHDDIGYPLCCAGDVDHDGYLDYATSNYFGSSRSVLRLWSGHTGAAIREWSSTTEELGSSLLGGLDVDLDGVPDLIGSAPNFANGPIGPWGRVSARSPHDGQVLMRTEPGQNSVYPYYGRTLASLGVQPGNPYPVFALTMQPSGPTQRIEAWRWSPGGTSVVGTGCGTAGVPEIGVRSVQQAAGTTGRITLGSGAPGALGFCMVAPGVVNTYGGTTLPAPLDPYGLSGCTLYVPPTTVCAQLVGSLGMDRGYAAVDLPLPLVSSPTLGTQWAAQWLLLDPATSGYATTSRHEFRLQ